MFPYLGQLLLLTTLETLTIFLMTNCVDVTQPGDQISAGCQVTDCAMQDLQQWLLGAAHPAIEEKPCLLEPVGERGIEAGGCAERVRFRGMQADLKSVGSVVHCFLRPITSVGLPGSFACLSVGCKVALQVLQLALPAVLSCRMLLAQAQLPW